jgi:hypothetical protein
MDTKKSEPTDLDTPTVEATEPPTIPQPEAAVEPKKNRNLLFIIMAVLILAAAGLGHYLINHDESQTTASSSKSTQKIINTNPYAGWKTYSSPTEKASFQYPSNWTVTKPYIASGDSNNTDRVGIKSPSGDITISYVADLSGFGNEHAATYPLNTIISKTSIPNAPGLYVVSGTTTLDDTTYYPWIAVQESDGLVTNGVMGNLITFNGHFATNPTTDDFTGILFSTSGARTNQNSPALTKSKASAWFNTAEAKQAKLILMSLNDAANPAANWYLYESPGNNYAMRIPDGWNLLQNCSGQYAPLLLYADTLAITPGSKASVTNQCFGRDAQPGLSVQWYSFTDPGSDAQKTLDSFGTDSNLRQQATFQTDAGATVSKYYMNVTQQRQTIDQPEQGSYYYYVVKNSKGFVWVIYFYGPGQTDYHTNVERAVETMILN